MWMWSLFLACERPPVGVPDPSTFVPSQVDTGEEAPEDTGEDGDGNSAPRMKKIRIIPEQVYTNTDITAKAKAEDPDGDPIRIEYQWFVNGVKRVRDTQKRLDSSRFRKGDVLTVEVTALDETKKSRRTSAPVEVMNSPPVFAMKTGTLPKLDGFVVKATDLDGDVLKFKLENPPPGLTIDSATGEISFKGSQEDSEGGTFETRIIAEDDEGLQVIWPLTVTVSPGQKKEQRPAAESDAP